MSSRYWLQTQAPAGNWVDNLGCDDKQSCIDHGRYLMTEQKRVVRVIERKDVEVWTPHPRTTLTKDQLLAAIDAGGEFVVADEDVFSAHRYEGECVSGSIYAITYQGESGEEEGKVYVREEAGKLVAKF